MSGVAGSAALAEPGSFIVRLAPWQYGRHGIQCRAPTGEAIVLAFNVEAWRKAIRQDTCANYHFEMAVAIEREGDLVEAVKAFRRALDEKPDMIEARWCLAQALSRLKLEAEAESVRRTAGKDPLRLETEAMCALGWRAHSAGADEAAASHFLRAVALDAEFGDAHAGLGLIAFTDGRIEDGLASFAQAPLGCETGLNMAWELTAVGRRINQRQLQYDFKTAVPILRLSLLLAPGEADTYAELAHATYNSGLMDEAVPLSRHGLAIEPRNSLAHCRHAMFLVDIDNMEAEQALNTALALEPDLMRRSPSLLSSVLLTRGRFGELEAALRAIIGDSDRPEDWNLSMLAIVQHAQGRFDAALEIYRKQQVAMPQAAGPLGYMGLAFQAKGDIDAALHHQTLALAKDPNSAWIRSCYGLALQGAGRLDEAVDLHHRIVAENPDTDWPYTDCALALFALGDDDGGLAMLRRAVDRRPAWMWYHCRFKPWAWSRLDDALARVGFTSSPFWVGSLHHGIGRS